MDMLTHEDAVSGVRMAKVRDVPAQPVTGPRGGKRVPVRVLWRMKGTGLFQQVDAETHKPALYPYVEWHNGNAERVRYSGVSEWLRSLDAR